MIGSLLSRIRTLVENGSVLISDHGFDELAADGILAKQVIRGVSAAEVIREYPDYRKGPCVLVLQRDYDNRPIHVVWGIAKGESEPAVLVTAYRPNPDVWEPDMKQRRS